MQKVNICLDLTAFPCNFLMIRKERTTTIETINPNTYLRDAVGNNRFALAMVTMGIDMRIDMMETTVAIVSFVTITNTNCDNAERTTRTLSCCIPRSDIEDPSNLLVRMMTGE